MYCIFFFLLCLDLRLRLCSKEQRPGALNLSPHVRPPEGKKKVSVLLSTLYLFEDSSVSHDLVLES